MKTFIYLIVLCYSIHRITYVFVFLDMIKRRKHKSWTMARKRQNIAYHLGLITKALQSGLSSAVLLTNRLRICIVNVLIVSHNACVPSCCFAVHAS